MLGLRLLLFYIVFSGFPVPILAQTPINLSALQIDGHLEIGPNLEFVEESSTPITLSDIIDNRQSFDWRKVAQDSVNLGFSNHAYWFRFNIDNDSTLTQSILFEIDYPLLDKVDLYVVTTQNGSEHIQSFTAGDFYPYNDQQIRHPGSIFPFQIDPGQISIIYFRIETTSSMQFSANIWQPAKFYENDRWEFLVWGIFIGLMAIMALYNLFLFFATGDKSYVYFVFTALGYVGVEGIFSGTAFAYMWPESVRWNDICLIVISSIALASLARFSKLFLGLSEKMPKTAWLMEGYFWICLVNAVAGFILPYSTMIKITAVFVAIVPLSAYSAGIYLWLQGLKSARFFVLAFSFFTLAAIAFVLNKYGLIGRNILTENAIHLGSAVVVTFLSLALADRISEDRQQKHTAQKKSILHLQQYQDLYQNSLEGIFRIDKKGKPISVNPALAKLFGFSSQETFMREVTNIGDYLSAGKSAVQMLLMDLEHQNPVTEFELKGKTKDGTIFWGIVFARLVYDRTIGDHVIDGSINNITERKLGEEKLNYLARHDPLTDLINRAEFENRLNIALLHCREMNVLHAMFYMDLDQFKVVNDTCSHAAGDELLKQIALVFRTHLRQRDSLARLGGDEFGVLLEQCDMEKAQEIAHLIRIAVNEFRFTWKKQTFGLGISIGVVGVNAHSKSVQQLLSLADTACYAAKDAGRNRVYVCDETTGNLKKRQSEMQLVSTIREAINNDKLVLYKQDIASTSKSNKGDYFEILVRMVNGNQLTPPGAILPAAERFNLMPALDRWVIETLFNWLSNHPDALQNLHIVSVNLSGQSISDVDFSEFLKASFLGHNIPGEKICFEITETVAISNLKETLRFIETIRSYGAHFALDDFGTGFSSYSYLKTLPVNILKIDGSFIREIHEDPIDRVMVKSMTEIAHSMGLEVVAESVENRAALEVLKTLDVNFAQGFFIGKPTPLTSNGTIKRSVSM